MINKFKRQNSKVKIILFFFLFSFLAHPAISITPTANDEIKEKVQERIETIKQDAQKKAFWGTLKNRSNLVLIIDTNGEEKRIKTTTETVFVASNKKIIKINDLEIGNFLIALGLWQGNGNLDAKRILVLSSAPKPAIKRVAVAGQVSKIDTVKKTYILTRKKNNLTETISINSSTVIPTKIKLNDTIVIIGTRKEEGGIILAKIINVIQP